MCLLSAQTSRGMMVERPTGLIWEGDLDGSLEPCWRQPLTAIALIVSDVKDKAKGLDPTQLADRLGARVAPTQARYLQKARSNQGVDGSQVSKRFSLATSNLCTPFACCLYFLRASKASTNP